MNNISITRSPYRNELGFSTGKNDSISPQNKASHQAIKIDIHPYFLMSFLLVLAVFLSAASLMHFNRVTTQGYELRKLELTRQALVSESDTQNMHLAKAKAMSSILGSSRLDRMVKPSELVFVYNDTVIAKAN